MKVLPEYTTTTYSRQLCICIVCLILQNSESSLISMSLFISYNQQDATFLDLFIPTDALLVSGGSSAHHQEHKTAQYSLQVLSTNIAARC